MLSNDIMVVVPHLKKLIAVWNYEPLRVEMLLRPVVVIEIKFVVKYRTVQKVNQVYSFLNQSSEVVFEDEWGLEANWVSDPEGTKFTSAGPPKGASGAGGLS